MIKKKRNIRKSKLLKLFLTIALFIFSVYLLQILFESSYVESIFETHYIVSIIFLVVAKMATVIFAPLSWWIIYILAWTLLPLSASIFWLSLWNFLWISLAYFLWKRYWETVIHRFWWKKATKKAHKMVHTICNRKEFLSFRILFFYLEDLINFIAWMSRIKYVPFIIISMLATTVYMLVIIVWSETIFSYIQKHL